MLYKVKARQYGNAVEFEVAAHTLKEALRKAHEEANELFNYIGHGDSPTVDVKEAK